MISRKILPIQAVRHEIDERQFQFAGSGYILANNPVRRTADISIMGGDSILRDVPIIGVTVPKVGTKAWWLRDGTDIAIIGSDSRVLAGLAPTPSLTATYDGEMLMCVDSTYRYKGIIPLLGAVDGVLVGVDEQGFLEILHTLVEN